MRKCGWCGIYDVFSPLEEKPLMVELLEYGSVWNLAPTDISFLCVSRYDCQRRRPMLTFHEEETKDENWIMYLNSKYVTRSENFWDDIGEIDLGGEPEIQ